MNKTVRGRRSLQFGLWVPAIALAAVPAAAVAQSSPTDQSLPAQPPTTTPPPTPPPTFAEAGPFSFTGVLNVDGSTNTTGGLARSPHLLVKAALTAAYDGAADGHEGLSGLASAQYVNGSRLSASTVGDIQGVDNIEAFGAVRIYEAWLARDYSGRKGWKVGLIDSNTDFDTQETAALFLNASDGIGPELSHTGLNGPSIYPTTALGVTGFYRPQPGLTIRAGVFDGTAGSPDHPGRFAIRLSGRDGVLGIVQVEKRVNALRVEGGVWGYTAAFPSLHAADANGDPVRSQRSRGAYALVEGQIFKPKDAEDQGLAGWLRVGIGDPAVNRVSGYVGTGVVYTGLLKSRPSDQSGVSVMHAIVDDPTVALTFPSVKRTETTIEGSYRFTLRDWLAVQPDVQYVVHPNGDPTIGNALVVGVRLNFTLTRTLLRKIEDAAP